MTSSDTVLLLHPVLAIAFVLPLLGIAVSRAWQICQWRSQARGENKILLPPRRNRLRLKQWLNGTVIGVALVALSNDIFSNVANSQTLAQALLKVGFISCLLIVTIAALFATKSSSWRGIFATLAGVGLVILGGQGSIYRNTQQWYFLQFYYGSIAALLMVSLLVVLPNLRDYTNCWQKIYSVLNSIVLLLFLGQGMAGTLSFVNF